MIHGDWWSHTKRPPPQLNEKILFVIRISAESLCSMPLHPPQTPPQHFRRALPRRTFFLSPLTPHPPVCAAPLCADARSSLQLAAAALLQPTAPRRPRPLEQRRRLCHPGCASPASRAAPRSAAAPRWRRERRPVRFASSPPGASAASPRARKKKLTLYFLFAMLVDSQSRPS